WLTAKFAAKLLVQRIEFFAAFASVERLDAGAKDRLHLHENSDGGFANRRRVVLPCNRDARVGPIFPTGIFRPQPEACLLGRARVGTAGQSANAMPIRSSPAYSFPTAATPRGRWHWLPDELRPSQKEQPRCSSALTSSCRQARNGPARSRSPTR